MAMSSNSALEQIISEACEIPSQHQVIDELINNKHDFSKLFQDLQKRVHGISPLGNFEPLLLAFIHLVNSPVVAKALVAHPDVWIPKVSNLTGRDIELHSLLGAFFRISPLTDHTIIKRYPDVSHQCFSKGYADPHLKSKFVIIRKKMKTLYDGLAEVLNCLLRNPDAHENVLKFLAVVINKNAKRARFQVPTTCASSRMFVNLSAVMLALRDPSLDEKKSIDPKYVLERTRLNLRGLTALNKSSSKVSEWFKKNDDNEGEKSEYSFVCEWFFMTARVLHLGLMKGISEYNRLQHIPEKLCYAAQIVKDEEFIQRALSFYRLMVVWMTDLVGGFKLPLPTTCPKEFVSMPEHFVEDAMELLLFSYHNSITLDGDLVEDFKNFVIMFVASPEYIRNLDLRAKMVRVLLSLKEN